MRPSYSGCERCVPLPKCVMCAASQEEFPKSVKGLKAALEACKQSRGGTKEVLSNRLAGFLKVDRPVAAVKVGTV